MTLKKNTFLFWGNRFAVFVVISPWISSSIESLSLWPPNILIKNLNEMQSTVMVIFLGSICKSLHVNRSCSSLSVAGSFWLYCYFAMHKQLCEIRNASVWSTIPRATRPNERYRYVWLRGRLDKRKGSFNWWIKVDWQCWPLIRYHSLLHLHILWQKQLRIAYVCDLRIQHWDPLS